MGIEEVGNGVARLNHDDEPDTTKSGIKQTEQAKMEAAIQYLSENLLQDHWRTLRYALEEYLKTNEQALKDLLDTNIEDRKPGHHEEVGFAGQVVAWCSETLMHFGYARNEFGADI
jgi:hypothetical protein